MIPDGTSKIQWAIKICAKRKMFTANLCQNPKLQYPKCLQAIERTNESSDVFIGSRTKEGQYTAAGYSTVWGDPTDIAGPGTCSNSQLLQRLRQKDGLKAWSLKPPWAIQWHFPQSPAHKQMARIHWNDNKLRKHTLQLLKRNQRSEKKLCSSGDVWLLRKTKKKN